MDDAGAVGDAIGDGEAWVGEGLGLFAERFVRGDRDGCSFFALGEDLEEQLGGASIEADVAEFVDREEVVSAVACDGAGELVVIIGFGEFVGELGR